MAAPTPLGTFPLTVAHHLHVRHVAPHGTRVLYADIEPPTDPESTLPKSAVLRPQQTLNWPQSFARRGLHLTDYYPLSVETRHKPGTSDWCDYYLFHSITDGESQVFERPLGRTGPLQGDVVVCRHAQLMIKQMLAR